MGIFSKSCPLEKDHVSVYGIHSPKKWKKEDCQKCEYSKGSRCEYRQVATEKDILVRRGKPVLAKKSLMDKPAEMREQQEKAEINNAGFTSVEVEEYWSVSNQYDRLWESSSDDQRRDLVDCLDQWKIYLEKGYSPSEANQKAREWLRTRAEFRNS